MAPFPDLQERLYREYMLTTGGWTKTLRQFTEERGTGLVKDWNLVMVLQNAPPLPTPHLLTKLLKAFLQQFLSTYHLFIIHLLFIFPPY